MIYVHTGMWTRYERGGGEEALEALKKIVRVPQFSVLINKGARG